MSYHHKLFRKLGLRTRYGPFRTGYDLAFRRLLALLKMLLLRFRYREQLVNGINIKFP